MSVPPSSSPPPGDDSPGSTPSDSAPRHDLAPDAGDPDTGDPKTGDPKSDNQDTRGRDTDAYALSDQHGASGTDERWKRLRSLVNRLPGAVYRCTYDEDWISLYMGDGFKEITGLDPAALDPAGRSYRDVIVEDDIPRIQKAVAEAVDEGTYYSIEYRVRTDDGTIRWLEDNGRPYFGEDGVKWLDGILLDITRRKDAAASLRELTNSLEETVEMRTRQVRALAAELSVVEQQERSDIARTLHDELQQFLYGVQVQTKMLLNDIQANPNVDPDDFSVDPDRVERLLQQAIQTTRGLTVDLAPPVLDSDGLVESLQWLRSHFDHTRNFTVHLEGDGLTIDLPNEIRLVLFQAVRELLMNVHSHAEVAEAVVRIEEEDDDIVIDVEDRGCGFDVRQELTNERAGYGLRTASERLRLLGGSFTIESTLDEGTTCTIVFPKEKLTDFPSSPSEHDVPTLSDAAESGTASDIAPSAAPTAE
jgi:PAS domain S-box-containing protein